jgi:hypothetical protein
LLLREFYRVRKGAGCPLCDSASIGIGEQEVLQKFPGIVPAHLGDHFTGDRLPGEHVCQVGDGSTGITGAHGTAIEHGVGQRHGVRSFDLKEFYRQPPAESVRGVPPVRVSPDDGVPLQIGYSARLFILGN